MLSHGVSQKTTGTHQRCSEICWRAGQSTQKGKEPEASSDSSSGQTSHWRWCLCLSFLEIHTHSLYVTEGATEQEVKTELVICEAVVRSLTQKKAATRSLHHFPSCSVSLGYVADAAHAVAEGESHKKWQLIWVRSLKFCAEFKNFAGSHLPNSLCRSWELNYYPLITVSFYVYNKFLWSVIKGYIQWLFFFIGAPAINTFSLHPAVCCTKKPTKKEEFLVLYETDIQFSPSRKLCQVCSN